MKTSRTRIAHTIAKHTLSRGASKQYARKIAAYLLSEHRTRELDSLLRDVQAYWANAGHVEAAVSSAHPLSSAAKEEVRNRAKKLYPFAKEITVTEAHDPQVIGGVRISLPNRQYDLTVEGKLNKLKQQTTAGKG